LTIAVLFYGRQIFIPLALALVLSFLLTPFVGLLEKCHLRRTPAVVLVLAICFVSAGVVGWAVANQLLEITAHIVDYRANLDDKIQSLHAPDHGVLGQATSTVRELNKELAAAPQQAAAARERARDSNAAQSHPIPVQVAAPPSSFAQDLRELLGPLSGTLETSGAVIIFTAFMLVKREDLRNRLIRLGGQGQLNVMTQALDDASHRLSRYLMLQFLINSSYGALFGLGLYLIGVPHPLLWGTLAALLRFVPYVGTLIAAAFPVAIALAVFPGWAHALLTFGLFLILDLIIVNIVEPWIYGAHTGISSFAILVAAVFWTTLWGPVGLILSTPLTVCLMLIGRYAPQLGFLDVLLGDEPVLSAQEVFYQRLLAMDQDEARRIVETHLQEHSLENLYESVLIPALRLAEEDRHMDALGTRTSEFIYQGTRELIEDLGDRFEKEDAEAKIVEGESETVRSPTPSVGVVCLPARDEADELVGMMLSQLLRQSGNGVHYLPIGTVDDMLEQVSRGNYRIACVSALPPFAVGQARSLCKRLRARFPDLAIVVGLWDFAGGVPKAQERVGPSCTDAVATTLTEAMLQVRRLAETGQADHADALTSCNSAAR
jgi:predicted PurR-regulated permease PerM